MKQPIFLLVLGILLSSLVGCGDGRPTTYPVSGTVKFEDGDTVRMGYIELIPVAGGPSARAKLDPVGRFKLGTFEQEDGAIAGEHFVIVTQPAPLVDAQKARSLGPEHEKHADDRRLVSLKYSSRSTTDLKINILKHSNQLIFKLDYYQLGDSQRINSSTP